MVQNQTKTYLDPAKVRHRRRYQRKPIVEAARRYIGDTGSEWTSTGQLFIHQQGRSCKAFVTGGLKLPVRCSRCGGLTEGQDHWCPNCLRVERL